MRLVPLLLLAACQQPALDAVSPDELHLWGSRGWDDGEISTGDPARAYGTTGDSYAMGVGLTWSLAPPRLDHGPTLERIARAVERREEPLGPSVLVIPQTDAREPDGAPEPASEDSDDHWQQTAKALGGAATLIGLLWASIRQARKSSSAAPYPVDDSAAD